MLVFTHMYPLTAVGAVMQKDLVHDDEDYKLFQY